MAFTIFVILTILSQLVTSVVATLICAGKNSPFTWEQVLKVLYQPAVGGNRVADELKKKFRRQCKQFLFHYDRVLILCTQFHYEGFSLLVFMLASFLYIFTIFCVWLHYICIYKTRFGPYPFHFLCVEISNCKVKIFIMLMDYCCQ